MLRQKIPYQDVESFSALILDYIKKDDKLNPFINHFPEIDNFQLQIEEKENHQLDRSALVKVLKKQNKSLNLSVSSNKNIDLLDSSTTFSVTTGHQLCLFTGPLYFIYKIISAVNLCEQLTVKYPSSNFVPIFWMATEDHDFQEVNHIYLFGQKIEWDNKENGSAVGTMSLDGFESVISELKSILGSNSNADKLISLFERSYLDHNNLADATRFLVNELFGEYGLVIIDGNDKDLKMKFIPQIKKDVLARGFSKTIKQCTDNLTRNYKAQAFIRDINFFKLSVEGRDLIKEDVQQREIEENPERFSPNVLLRPLYQEAILPNIAYVGGEAEVAYWMQLRTAFEQEQIPFPVLVLRNSALLIGEKQQNRFLAFGFKIEDIFLSEDQLKKRYVMNHSNSDISLEDAKNDLNLLYQNIILKTSDVVFQNSIKAQLKKHLSVLDNFQDKLIRNEKKKNEISIKQIEKIKSQLFPNNTLQERFENFITYYLKDGDNFIKTLKNSFDPLTTNFVVLTLKN